MNHGLFSNLDKIITVLTNNGTNYVYSLLQGQLLGDNVIKINDAKRLNEIALEQRDSYSKYIYSLNKLFI